MIRPGLFAAMTGDHFNLFRMASAIPWPSARSIIRSSASFSMSRPSNSALLNVRTSAAVEYMAPAAYQFSG